MTIKGFAGASKPPIYDQRLYVQEEERLMTPETTLDVSHKRLDLQLRSFASSLLLTVLIKSMAFYWKDFLVTV
jgi:hypothetical protein